MSAAKEAKERRGRFRGRLDRFKRRLSKLEFTLLAIEVLRRPQDECIHVVFSGYTEEFRAYFKGADPKKAVEKMHKEGTIIAVRARRGPCIFDPKRPPTRRGQKAREARKKKLKERKETAALAETNGLPEIMNLSEVDSLFGWYDGKAGTILRRCRDEIPHREVGSQTLVTSSVLSLFKKHEKAPTRTELASELEKLRKRIAELEGR